MDAGETADLVVITPQAIEQLTKQGKVLPGTEIEIARSLIGIAVKRGAPKPDIGTPDALRKNAARGEIGDLLRAAVGALGRWRAMRGKPWWGYAEVARHDAMMFDRHRQQIAALRRDSGTTVLTAFRRVRQGQQRMEVRFDGGAGCLRRRS